MNWRVLCFFLLFLSSAEMLSAKQKKPFFFVIIPSRNNENYCIENLESVVKQNYTNWRAVYINDFSADRTGNKVEEYVTQKNLRHKIKIIHNHWHKGALANIYNGVKMAKKNWVVITLDGDDTLRGTDVFSTLAKIYRNKKVWMTYGNWESNPPGRLKSDNERIPKEIMKKNRFRKYKFCTTQLRTFYAGLFRKIRRRDLQHKGKFYMAAGDVAFMIPLLEMASKNHIHFVEQVIYNYRIHPNNDFQVNGRLQGWCGAQIGKKKRYTPLKKASWM